SDGRLTPSALSRSVDPFAPTTVLVRDAGKERSPPRSEPAEANAVEMRVLQLLTARLCHELSGPLAAINNGAELLAEEEPACGAAPATGFLGEAAGLIVDSARRAGNRLRFYRFAYGSGHGAAIAGPAPPEL